MSKPTPGPWHWEADVVKGDPTGRVRYQVTALGKTVTRVYYSSYEGGPTNAKADAMLISAAPDMLEALIAVKEVLDFAIGADLVPPGADGPAVMARAAIAKATGEQE